MKRVVILCLLLIVGGCRGEPVLMLNDFETEDDLARLTWRCPFWIEPTGAFTTSGARGLAVEFATGVYPTIELREVPADWHAYRWFEVDLWAPNLAGRELMLRLDDQGDVEEFADRFEMTVPLTGAPQHLRIPLERVAAGNGGRRQDLHRMRRVLFYFQSLDERAIVYFDKVQCSR
jgi:hypothetical protein